MPTESSRSIEMQYGLINSQEPLPRPAVYAALKLKRLAV